MSRPLPGFVTKKKGEKTKSQFPLLRFSGTVVYVSESGHCQRLCLNLLRHLNPPAPPQLPPAASDKSQSPQNSAGMDGSSCAGAQEASAPEHTSVLGFDIEWKVIWQKGSAPRPAALLQVPTVTLHIFESLACFLTWDLNELLSLCLSCAMEMPVICFTLFTAVFRLHLWRFSVMNEFSKSGLESGGT